MWDISYIIRDHASHEKMWGQPSIVPLKQSDFDDLGLVPHGGPMGFCLPQGFPFQRFKLHQSCLVAARKSRIPRYRRVSKWGLVPH